MVADCSALGDSPLVQVQLGLVQKPWPTEHCRPLGQHCVVLLQYLTGTGMVR